MDSISLSKLFYYLYVYSKSDSKKKSLMPHQLYVLGTYEIWSFDKCPPESTV